MCSATDKGTYAGDGCKSFIKFRGKPTSPDFSKVTVSKAAGTKSVGFNVRAGSAAANTSLPAFKLAAGNYVCMNEVTFPAPAGASYTVKMKPGTKFKSTVNIQVSSRAAPASVLSSRPPPLQHSSLQSTPNLSLRSRRNWE